MRRWLARAAFFVLVGACGTVLVGWCLTATLPAVGTSVSPSSWPAGTPSEWPSMGDRRIYSARGARLAICEANDQPNALTWSRWSVGGSQRGSGGLNSFSGTAPGGSGFVASVLVCGWPWPALGARQWAETPDP